MLSLSLLLSAAAGVNAILGGEVKAVKIAEGQFICADNCAHDGVYFGQRGFYSPVQELVGIVDPEGEDPPDVILKCTGDRTPPDHRERSRRDGEEPIQCTLVQRDDQCISNRSLSSGKNSKTIEWSEVAGQLKEPTLQDGQGSSTEKPVDCAVEALAAFQKCNREPNPSFDKCNQQGIEANEKCRQQS